MEDYLEECLEDLLVDREGDDLEDVDDAYEL